MVIETPGIRTGWGYVATTVLTLLILIWVLRLWDTDLRLPIYYQGSDNLLTAMFVKSAVDQGWIQTNPHLGAPFGQNLGDYPVPDTLHLVIMKVFGWFLPGWVAAFNLYIILKYPLTALIAVFVLRRFGIGWPASMMAAILYAFLPYTFYRGGGHFFLACYYLVPLVILMVVRLAEDRPLFTVEKNGHPGWKWTERRGLMAATACAVVALAGIYYSFFAGILLLIGGVLGSVRHRSWRPMMRALVLGGVLLLVLVVNLSPNLIYQWQHGNNPATAHRSPSETEVFGLRITQLLVPINGHRVPLLGKIRTWYDTQATVIPPNENGTACLGLVGASGFLLLLGWQLFGTGSNRLGRTLTPLAAMTLVLVLIASMGGFSLVIAALLVSGIRAYNRVTPYLGFLSLAAIALVLDAAQRKWGQARPLAWDGLFAALLILGVLDQTQPAFTPMYARQSAEFIQEADFVRQVEKKVPPGAMIFQLPYIPFPENPPVQRMTDYDLLRPYMHSSTLRWSYGAVKGRYGDSWQKAISAQIPAQMAATLSIAGFSGIYIDRNGYADAGAALERDLAGVLNTRPIDGANGRLLFFSLADFAATLRKQYAQADWQTRREAVLHPVMTEWHGGCSGLETGGGRSWRWCGHSGELWIINSAGFSREMTLAMTVSTPNPEDANLLIDGGGPAQAVITNPAGRTFTRTITADPGRTVVRFKCDGRPLHAPSDPRTLVFRVDDVKITDASSNPFRLQWLGGFSGLEQSPGKTWRWCAANGVLRIENTSHVAREIQFDMVLVAGNSTPSKLRVESPGFSDTLQLGGAPQPFAKTVMVPPGQYDIRFSSNGKPLVSSGDPRTLIFRAEDFHCKDLYAVTLTGN